MEVKNDEPIPKFTKDHQNPNIPNDFDAKGYSLNGKIMLCAIILLFFIIVLMLCLHIYARWYLLQSRRRRNRLRRRTQLVFFSDNPTTTTASAVVASRGLDASVIAKLPLFFYDPKTQLENVPECAVCLSEFESGETGRVLPKCKHSFHTECIDMWFHSHDTCPLCRAPVEAMFTRPEVVITVCEPETGSSSGLIEDESGSRTGEEVGSSSVGLRRKPSFTGVTVEVPTRNEDFRDESPSSTQSSFRSMLSFKRILSMDWKGSVSPSSCGGNSSAIEVLSSNPDKNSRSNNINIES